MTTLILAWLFRTWRRWRMRKRTQQSIDDGWTLAIDEEPTERALPPPGNPIVVVEMPGIETIRIGDGRVHRVGSGYWS